MKNDKSLVSRIGKSVSKTLGGGFRKGVFYTGLASSVIFPSYNAKADLHTAAEYDAAPKVYVMTQEDIESTYGGSHPVPGGGDAPGSFRTTIRGGRHPEG